MNRLTPALPLEIKRADVDAKGVFTGLASTYGGPPDSYGDIISKGAFQPALRQMERDDTLPAMLWSHDHKEPVGKWLSLKDSDQGLLVTGKLTLGTRRGKEAHALLKDQAIALSIGFALAKDGARTVGSIRHITKIALLAEISLVALPANTRAKIISTRSRPETRRDYEHILRDAAGLSAREAKRAAAGGWGALVRQEQDSDMSRVLIEIQDLRDEILRTR